MNAKRGGSVGGLGFDNARRWREERSPENVWITPQWILSRVRDVFGGPINFDPCTTPGNPCDAERFVCEPDDGILAEWSGDVYCNPPFSAATVKHWVDKCLMAQARGARVLLLLPMRMETVPLQIALREADAALFFSGRVDFEGMTRHTAVPCVLFAFGVDLDCMSDLGVIVKRKEVAA